MTYLLFCLLFSQLFYYLHRPFTICTPIFPFRNLLLRLNLKNRNNEETIIIRQLVFYYKYADCSSIKNCYCISR